MQQSMQHVFHFALVGLCASTSAAAFQANDLWPESGVFVERHNPYHVRLEQDLFQKDTYRLCQLVEIPSFSVENAVYFVRDDAGKATVVSRTFRRSLWGAMMREIERSVRDKRSYSVASPAQELALAKIHPEVETRRASLDEKDADLLADLCRRTLLRTRYPSGIPGGRDGESYHAGHWISGEFLAGQTWSPDKDTIAADFVALEKALKAYAEADDSRRAVARTELMAQARKLATKL